MSAIRLYLSANKLTLSDLANAVERSRDTVKKWGREYPVPAWALPRLELWSNGALSGRELRPDLYGDQ